MGRPSTKAIGLKDGYYIEVKTGEASGIKIHRKTKEEIETAMKSYKKNREVNYLGLVKNGKFIEENKK